MLNPALNRRPATRAALLAIIGAIFCISLPLAAMTFSPEVIIAPPPLVAAIPAPQAPPARVSGAVTDTRGAAVAGATVILSTPDGRTQGTTSTNAAGTYTFTGLPAGAYVVQVFANSFGPSRMTNITAEAGKDVRQDVKMDIGFVRDSRASGEGSISGKVVDSSGLLIPGVQIILASPDLPDGNRTTTTDEKGGYRFDSLPRGTYLMTSRLPGFKTLNQSGIRVFDTAIRVDTRLEVASMAEEITIRSSRSSAPSTAPVAAAACAEPPPSLGARGNRGSSGGLGGNVQVAMLLGQTKPVYPAEAKSQDVQGTVILQTMVGKDGRILQTKLINGNPLLATAAIDAIKLWCYRPTLLNGQPIEVLTTVTVNFVLQDQD